MYSYSVKTFAIKVHVSTGVFIILLSHHFGPAHFDVRYFVIEARNISTLSSVCTSIVNHFSDRSLPQVLFSRYSRQVSHTCDSPIEQKDTDSKSWSYHPCRDTSDHGTFPGVSHLCGFVGPGAASTLQDVFCILILSG